jgi:3-deoxy-D-manno-octulosonic-acid transferase
VTGQETANFVSEFTKLSAAKACIITKPDMLDTALQKALASAETLARNASRTFPAIDDPKTLLNKISAALNAQT